MATRLFDEAVSSQASSISMSLSSRHPFDSSKWGNICRLLVASGMLDRNCLVELLEASTDYLLVLHSESYLNSLKNSSNVAAMIEVPPVALFSNCLLQRKVLFPSRKQVGGTILAAKFAKERGWAINIGGGFHHCSAEKGGGFCVFADISLCIRFALVQLNISRVMIIDLDAHQGNGHEMDFANDSRVYILDMYNPGIYPFIAEHRFVPELVVYNAGTDILDGDPLGRLKDEKVFQFAREKKVPIVMLTSGVYMKSSAKVIADSIVNLSNRREIDVRQSPKFK